MWLILLIHRVMIKLIRHKKIENRRYKKDLMKGIKFKINKLQIAAKRRHKTILKGTNHQKIH